jgi:hypothetical protein
MLYQVQLRGIASLVCFSVADAKMASLWIISILRLVAEVEIYPLSNLKLMEFSSNTPLR